MGCGQERIHPLAGRERAPGGRGRAPQDFDWEASLAGLPQFDTTGRRIVRMGGVQEKAVDTLGPRTDERPRLSVVVPVRNEAGNIGPLVEEIAASLAAKAPFEVVYVDDGSTDETSAEIARLMVERPWLRHVRHAVSYGQSAAVRTGVAAAYAPLVATLDGDGQNDPAFLPALVEQLEQSGRIGLVAGQRIGRKDTGFKNCNLASPIRCAAPCCGTAPATPAAA